MQCLMARAASVQPGVTTDEIDRAVHKMVVDNGAYPSPLRYGECCSRPPRAASHLWGCQLPACVCSTRRDDVWRKQSTDAPASMSGRRAGYGSPFDQDGR